MKIIVSLHGHLNVYSGGRNQLEVELDPPCTVNDLLPRTLVPQSEIAFVAVNGYRVSMDHALREGDRVKLFQFVAGG